MQTFGLSGDFHGLAAGDDDRLDRGLHLPAVGGDDLGSFTQVADAAVRARTNEHDVDGEAGQLLTRGQTHVGVSLFDGLALVGGKARHGGQGLVDAHAVVGRDTPGDIRGDVFGAEGLHIVKHRMGVTRHRRPPGHCLIPGCAGGRVLAALEVGEGRGIGIDIAATSAALDGHVAHRHALFHGHGGNRGARELIGEANPALGGEDAQDVENDVLSKDPGGQLAVDLDLAHFHALHRHGLGREHVADLAGADAKGDRTEGAMSSGVTIATCHGHARLGQALLRGDDVDHALLARTGLEQADAVLAAIPLDVRHHFFGLDVGVGPRLILGRDDVVDRGDGALGIRHFQTTLAQHGECLRAGNLMDQVQPDEKLGLARGHGADGVEIPHLVVEGAGAHGVPGGGRRRVPRWGAGMMAVRSRRSSVYPTPRPRPTPRACLLAQSHSRPQSLPIPS